MVTIGLRLCDNVGEEGIVLCFKVDESSWEDLPHSWFWVSSSNVHLEDMNELSLWWTIYYV